MPASHSVQGHPAADARAHSPNAGPCAGRCKHLSGTRPWPPQQQAGRPAAPTATLAPMAWARTWHVRACYQGVCAAALQRCRSTLTAGVPACLTCRCLRPRHTGGYASLTASVDAWYNEVASYNFANPGWSGATGHFTQVVWKDTTKLGCAINSGCPQWATYVCQYQIAGNLLSDDWPNQVLPASAAPAAATPATLQPVAPVAPRTPTPAPAPAQAPPPALAAVPTAVPGLAPELQAALDRHNMYRARHQVRHRCRVGALCRRCTVPGPRCPPLPSLAHACPAGQAARVGRRCRGLCRQVGCRLPQRPLALPGHGREPGMCAWGVCARETALSRVGGGQSNSGGRGAGGGGVVFNHHRLVGALMLRAPAPVCVCMLQGATPA
jgi:hypothetical protein